MMIGFLIKFTEYFFYLYVKGKKYWVSNIKLKLFSLGFGFLWMNQGVQNVRLLISKLKERQVCVDGRNGKIVLIVMSGFLFFFEIRDLGHY